MDYIIEDGAIKAAIFVERIEVTGKLDRLGIN